MRIFLAGSTGVLGRRIVPLLLAQGHQVTCLTRRERERFAEGAHVVVADVYDRIALTDAVVAAAPDVVLHQLTDLGGGDRIANAKIRTTGTRNLVDAALAAGTRRIIAQSIAWAYEGGDRPATEETPLDLHSDPARLASVAGVAGLESTVRELPDWVILRYGLFYGESTWYSADGMMAGRARSGNLVADADITSFVHVDDAAAAAVAALDWPTGPVNVCDDEPAAGSDWLPLFCESVGAPRPPSSASKNAWARGADNHYARKHLDWTPSHPTWRTGFTRSAR
ncbi:MAG: NAD(P)-dependent oxidoreductase [Kibdelosporangium sp.]